MDCRVSVIINVKNAEHTLNRCLASLYRFSDIVVFDNYSTDTTIEIAATYPGVRIIQHEFCGMGNVRNLAATHAKYAWVFFIDSDEVLHSDLAAALFNLNPVSGSIYSILRRNFYANMWVNSSAWENDWVPRLYNRNETRYTEAQVHEAVICNNMQLQRIDAGFIYHFPYHNVGGLIDKMQLYSSWYAKEHYLNKRPYLWLIPFRSFFMFIKCYIFKRGFLDGFQGFVISSYNAIGVFSKYIKLYELHNRYFFALALTVDQPEDLPEIIQRINLQKLLPEYVYISTPHSKYSSATTMINNYLQQLCVPYTVMDNNNYLKQAQNNGRKPCYILSIEDNSMLRATNLLMVAQKSVKARTPLVNTQLIKVS